MEILGKNLSEKTEKLYNAIAQSLIYPVKLESSGSYGYRKKGIYRKG